GRHGRIRDAEVTTVYPGGVHTRHDLVVDRVDRRGPFPHGGAALRAVADQHHIGPHRGRVVATVDDELVHADTADHGPSLTCQPHLHPTGQRARHTVGIPHRYQR